VDFRGATGKLIELGVTLREMADAMGVSHSLLVQARMHPSAKGHRNPPDQWREALQGIAAKRGKAFAELAKKLERELR
jgi:hypothetical protein